MLPFAALVAGTAPGIVALIYGPDFFPAAPLLSVLFFGAVASTMMAVGSGVLTAADHPGLSLALTWPLLPLGIGAHLWLIPRYGPLAAAAVTTTALSAGAALIGIGIYRQCGVLPRKGTVVRTVVMGVVVYAISKAWATSGIWLIVELGILSLLVVVGLTLLGELRKQDMDFARSLLCRERDAAQG
jgi:O-antigen/teichoic acid export membrane protein